MEAELTMTKRQAESLINEPALKEGNLNLT